MFEFLRTKQMRKMRNFRKAIYPFSLETLFVDSILFCFRVQKDLF